MSISEKCAKFMMKEFHKIVITDGVSKLSSEVLRAYIRCSLLYDTAEQQNYYFNELKDTLQNFFIGLEKHSGYVDKTSVLSILIATLSKYDKEITAANKKIVTEKEKGLYQTAIDFIMGRRFTLFDPYSEITEKAKEICAEKNLKMRKLPSEKKVLKNEKK